MATYPSLPFARASRRTPLNPIVEDQAADGTPLTRDAGGAEAYEFEAVHTLITEAEAWSVYDTWANNRGAVIALTWTDSVAYNCLFVAPPDPQQMIGAYWQVTARLRGVPA